MSVFAAIHAERAKRLVCQYPKLEGPVDGPRTRVECTLPLGHEGNHDFPALPPALEVKPPFTTGELASCSPSDPALVRFRDELQTLLDSSGGMPALRTLVPLAGSGALERFSLYTAWHAASRALLAALRTSS